MRTCFAAEHYKQCDRHIPGRFAKVTPTRKIPGNLVLQAEVLADSSLFVVSEVDRRLIAVSAPHP